MEPLFAYLKQRGGLIHKNIQDKKVPTEEQLNKFTTETVEKFQELIKKAPHPVKNKVSSSWYPYWDFWKNLPGRDPLDAPKLLGVLGKIRDGLTNTPPPASESKGKGKGKAKAAEEEEEEKKPRKFTGADTTEVMVIEANYVGRIVGPKGATLKMIQDASECKIDISAGEVTIMGPEDGMPIAVKAITELTTKGFCALAYGDDFTEADMNVHPIYFSELIGKQGMVIRAIKDKLQVELNIPKIPQGSKVREMTKKMKVGFAGKKADVEKAKAVVGDIILYYHHDITHGEEVVHEEIEIEQHQTRFVIGRGGSESKHIQNSYKIKMYIPNEHSANDKLLLVGEQKNIENASKYIANMLQGAEDRMKAADRTNEDAGPKVEDHWGDDKDHEDWMDPYVYKRR